MNRFLFVFCCAFFFVHFVSVCVQSGGSVGTHDFPYQTMLAKVDRAIIVPVTIIGASGELGVTAGGGGGRWNRR